MSEPISLYVDTYGKQLVASTASLAPVSIGTLFYGDIVSFRVYLLIPNPTTSGNYPNPWTVINNNDLSLQVAIGDVNTNDTTTPMASQVAWSKDADNKYFFADLQLNTAALKAALGGLASLQSTFEIKQDKGGNKATVYQQTVIIKPRAIGPTTVVPVAPDTPISKEEAAGTYLPRIGAPGDVLRLVSANGVYGVDLYVDNDGIFHQEQVTI